MPRTCTVCQHDSRQAVDEALINQQPYRHIAARFGLSTGALQRHRDGCLPVSLSVASRADEVQADDLLEQLQQIKRRALSLLDQAEQAGDLRTALAGVREVRATLELLAELEQRIDRRPQVTLVASVEWLSVRATLLAALRPYPEARAAVSASLERLEASA